MIGHRVWTGLIVFGQEGDVMSIQTHRIVTLVANFGAPSPLHGGPAHLIQHIERLQGVLQAEPPHPEDVIKAWDTNWIIALKVKKPYSRRLKLKLQRILSPEYMSPDDDYSNDRSNYSTSCSHPSTEETNRSAKQDENLVVTVLDDIGQSKPPIAPTTAPATPPQKKPTVAPNITQEQTRQYVVTLTQLEISLAIMRRRAIHDSHWSASSSVHNCWHGCEATGTVGWGLSLLLGTSIFKK
ncbi:hypothetical protein Bbelb_008740 [Branchiostoma belcheri]|nr:hypothetical protein Bbelb_008740 [Branchiostoma belcheri]